MRMCRSSARGWMLVGCVVGALGSLGSPCFRTDKLGGPGGSGSGSNQGSGSGNANPGLCSTYAFPPLLPTALSIGDCPREACGLNGVWLGAGVPFRTLHLNGAENPQHLSILGFHDAH